MTRKIVTIGSDASELSLEREGATFRSGTDAVEIVELTQGEALLRVNGRMVRVPFAARGSEISFVFDGEVYDAEVSDQGVRTRAKHRDHSMASPMPGLVLRVLAAKGADVKKGDALIVLEAMKMEHTIAAPRDGRIADVHCSEGEMVQGGVELVSLE